MDEQQALVQTSQEAIAPIADDTLLYVAQQAERRIEAVKKIKQIALSITNATDWTDQQGKPYIMASGSEKIANLFSISWQIEEPQCETEEDGHFTYTYRGTFSLGGRTIQVEGSRSSKDPFFKKYEYGKDADGRDTKVEKPISAIDRRDVKMAAMTNLLGNGITRILGIRNLTWEDLRAYANITQEMVNSKIKYGTKGEPKPPISEPQRKSGDMSGGASEAQLKAIFAILTKLGITDDMAKHERVAQILGLTETPTSLKVLTKTQASTVIETLDKEAKG